VHNHVIINGMDEIKEDIKILRERAADLAERSRECTERERANFLLAMANDAAHSADRLESGRLG
jgi:hypothetical protein